jgi:hypothetical protein
MKMFQNFHFSQQLISNMPAYLLHRNQPFSKLQPMMASTSIETGGQEPILPAVLEFPEQHQEPFLQQVITELDVNSPNFKLAPVYTLYLCARYVRPTGKLFSN